MLDSRSWMPIVYIAVAVMCIIELGLTAYLAAVANGPWTRSPDQVNFMLFNSLWTLLAVAYLGLSMRFFPRLYHSMVALGLTAVTMLFWFAGSIALAVYQGGYGCGFLNAWCNSLRAAIAFGFFIWGCFLALTIQEVLNFMHGRRGGVADTTKPHAYPGV